MDLSDLQSKIDSLKAEWDAVQPLQGEQFGRWWQKLRLEWNYNSNHIEGNTLTYGETRLLILQGIATGTHDLREFEEMKAHDVAIEHVRAMAGESRPITEADVRDLNQILLKEPFSKPARTPDGQPTPKRIIPGVYKTMPNNVETITGEMFYFSSPDEVPAKMAELVQWFRDNLEGGTPVVPLITAFHHRFSVIHPFDDGNGRTMRLLVNYALMRRGYPPLVIRSTEKKEYLAALSQADAGDLVPFELFLAKNLMSALELGLKAAHGESLEEPEDWQKEMKLLVREYSIPTPPPERTWHLLRQLATSSWQLVLRRSVQKLKELEKVFESKEAAFIPLRPDGVEETIVWRLKEKLLVSQLFQGGPTNSEIFPSSFGLSIHFKNFLSTKGDPFFDVSALVEFKLSDRQYSIDGSFLKKSFEGLRYDAALNEDQIEYIATAIAKEIVRQVKGKVDP